MTMKSIHQLHFRQLQVLGSIVIPKQCCAQELSPLSAACDEDPSCLIA